jgi:NADH-quinone oxidoreductase subunit K
MEITLNHYLILSAILFSIGTAGVLIRRNAIIIFMSVELMLNAVNITLVAFSRYQEQIAGEVFVFFVMAVAAAEAAVGLVILIAANRYRNSIDVDEISELKG